MIDSALLISLSCQEKRLSWPARFTILAISRQVFQDESTHKVNPNSFNWQVSWLKHTTPIPQLMALNNLSNSLDSRVKAMVGEDWSEFVLMIRDVRPEDGGEYECQVSGRNHTTSSKIILLNVIGNQRENCLSQVDWTD